MKFDSELVTRAQAGDMPAFEGLVDAFRDMAIGYAYSILQDYHHAEDAAQESFAQAFFKLKALQAPEAFPSWFRKIVFSRCEHIYRKKSLPAVPLEDACEAQSPAEGPAEIVERDELRGQLWEAVRALPEKERTVTLLFYSGGYSMAEVSRFLDLPVSTVKSRLYSARAKLREDMTALPGGTFKNKKSSKEFTERVKNMIVSGYKQALLLKDDGTVMKWGNKSKPAAVMGLKNVKSMAASSGCHGSFALLDDGTVWAWGWNYWRHLGTGSQEYIPSPEKVQGIGDVVSIAAGVSHTLALRKDGSVWVWGMNWYGQLGIGRDSDTPYQVPGLKKIKQISAGYFHSLALAEDGTVWRWGGYGNSEFEFPIAYAVNTPVPIETPGKIIAISAGGMHNALLCEDGTVWACGYNTFRQLGSNRVFNEILDGPVRVGGLSQVKAISAGGQFTLALKEDGTVWAWGFNENGELGNGAYDEKTRIALGDNKSEPTEVFELQDVVEIAAGCFHAMAVTNDGGIWAWGSNDEGQLGDFAQGRRCVPQRIMQQKRKKL